MTGACFQALGRSDCGPEADVAWVPGGDGGCRHRPVWSLFNVRHSTDGQAERTVDPCHPRLSRHRSAGRAMFQRGYARRLMVRACPTCQACGAAAMPRIRREPTANNLRSAATDRLERHYGRDGRASLTLAMPAPRPAGGVVGRCFFRRSYFPSTGGRPPGGRSTRVTVVLR